ncbi:ABC transporter permease [Rhodospirillaceae bacterium SYSU D60014]|uniref:ABC transporter permease n=1 Tax=Virgifigura deserti TaxID=2268457 RepID=UPI000E667AB3
MKEFWKRFSRNRSAVAGLLILIAVILLAILAPILYPEDPFSLVGLPMVEPFEGFLLGTDILGRNVAAGIAHGAKVSLLIGLFATLVAMLIGILIGAAAGYYGGWIDDALMRLTELFQTIPSFLFAILLVAIMTPSIESIVIAIAVVSWPTVARLVRGEFLALRKREFVEACVGVGMSDWRIITLQILPNCLSPIIVTGSLMVATAILIESGLSFLGLGDPNVMSWGFMVGAGRTVLRSAWWVCAFPGIAILLTVLAINLVGEGLNDAFNPRLRNR